MAGSMNIGAALVNQVIAARDPNVKLASELMSAEAEHARIETQKLKGDLIKEYTQLMRDARDESEKQIWAQLIEDTRKL